MGRLDREKGQTNSVEEDSHGKTVVESPYLVSSQSVVIEENRDDGQTSMFQHYKYGRLES